MKKFYILVTALMVCSAGFSQSWGSQFSASSLYDIGFSSPTSGWAVGYNNLFARTTDGLSWVESTLNYPTNSVLSTVYPYPTQTDKAMIGGGWSILAKTIDSGVTWIDAQLPNSNAVWFTDIEMGVNTGYSVGFQPGDIPVIYKTTDDGDTWTDVSMNIPLSVTGKLFAIDYESPSKVLFCGANGVILLTTDGGASFSVIPSGTTEDLNKMDVSGGEGWIVGNQGTILRSTDGGSSWVNVIHSFDPFILDDVQIISPGEVFISGEIGIVHTTDAGATWTVEFEDLNTSSDRIKAIWIENQNQAWGIGYDDIYFRSTTNGINLITEDATQFYPNPVNDVLHISNLTIDQKVEILNEIGQIVLLPEGNTVNTSGLFPGVYFIKIKGSNGTSVNKFLKI